MKLPASPATPYLPTLDRARSVGLTVPAPYALRLRGVSNLLATEPRTTLPLAAVQTTGELSRRRGGSVVTETHDCTHVAGPLAALELPLRREVVAARRGADLPDALRISLETVTMSAGSYREAPRPERPSFEGFDCADAFALARAMSHRHASDTAVVRWSFEAHAIPVLLLVFQGLTWRRTVALHSLAGTVAIVRPWSD